MPIKQPHMSGENMLHFIITGLIGLMEKQADSAADAGGKLFVNRRG